MVGTRRTVTSHFAFILTFASFCLQIMHIIMVFFCVFFCYYCTRTGQLCEIMALNVTSMGLITVFKEMFRREKYVV